MPAGATSGPITVTGGGGTVASATNFTVITAPPTISSFTPSSGPEGTVEVTLTGTGFTYATAVDFWFGISASFTVVSDTQITATVPVGAVSGPITVTNAAGTATSATDFTVSWATMGTIARSTARSAPR